MARTPAVTREAVPEAQRETFDAIVAERGGVPSGGPGSVMLNAPEVAQRALGLALYLRTDTSLEPRIRELAMLVAARENDCQYIWNAHAPAGRQAGLRNELVDALRDRKELPNPQADEAGCGGVRPTVFPHPPGQPGSVRCRRVPLRRDWSDGINDSHGLLLDAGFQRERFRGRTSDRAHRGTASRLAVVAIPR